MAGSEWRIDLTDVAVFEKTSFLPMYFSHSSALILSKSSSKVTAVNCAILIWTLSAHLSQRLLLIIAVSSPLKVMRPFSVLMIQSPSCLSSSLTSFSSPKAHVAMSSMVLKYHADSS